MTSLTVNVALDTKHFTTTLPWELHTKTVKLIIISLSIGILLKLSDSENIATGRHRVAANLIVVSISWPTFHISGSLILEFCWENVHSVVTTLSYLVSTFILTMS